MSGIFWLASYPKSGNTWLRTLLTNYLRDADEPADINALKISGAGFMRENFDDRLGIDSADLTPEQILHYRPLVYERMASESRKKLFLKVHDAYLFNADGRPVFSRQATAGVIYLIRNPLDVAVSYAHHQDEPLDTIIDFMRSDAAMLAGSERAGRQLPQKLLSWSSHVLSWADAPGLKIHVVRYESLLARPVETFAAIIRFAGLEADARRVEKAVEFSRFERLQAQEAAHGFAEKQPTAVSFFRQGRADSWRDALTELQARQILADHHAVMRRFGYPATADEIFDWRQ